MMAPRLGLASRALGREENCIKQEGRARVTAPRLRLAFGSASGVLEQKSQERRKARKRRGTKWENRIARIW